MPEFAQDQIGQRQPLADGLQQQHQVTQVVAHPLDTFVTPAESNYSRLSSALSGFMKAGGEQYLKNKQDVASEAQRLQGLAKGVAAQPLPPTASPEMREGHTQATWDITAGKMIDEAAAEYALNKDTPGYDAVAAMQKRTQEDLTNIQDPIALKAYLGRTLPAIQKLQSEQSQHEVALKMQKIDTNLGTESSDLMARWLDHSRPDAISSPEEVSQGINGLIEKYRKQSKTEPEVATTIFQAAQAASLRDHGNPHAFDPLLQKGADGHSLLDKYPKLADHVEKALVQAEAAHHQFLIKDNYESNKAIYDHTLNLIKTDPNHPDIETYLDAMDATPYSATGTYGHYNSQGVAIRELWTKNKQAVVDAHNLAVLGDAGALAMGGATAAKKYAEGVLGEGFQIVGGAMSTPDAFKCDGQGRPLTPAAREFQRAISVQSKIGNGGEFIEQYKKLGESVALMLPPRDGAGAAVDPRFANLHDQWKMLRDSGNSALASKYVGQDGNDILQYYDELRRKGQAPVAAWQEAYKSFSPEGKKLADEALNNPTTKLAIAAAGFGRRMGDMSFTQQWLVPDLFREQGNHWYSPTKYGLGSDNKPFGTMADNTGILDEFKRKEATRYARVHHGDMSGVEGYLEERIKSNFVHDTYSNSLVQVPEGKVTPETQAALGLFAQKMGEIERGPNNKDPHSIRPIAIYDDATQTFAVHFRQAGGADDLNKSYSRYTMSQIENYAKLEKKYTPAERASLAALEKEAGAGTLTLEKVGKVQALVDRARREDLASTTLNDTIVRLKTPPPKQPGPLTQAVMQNGTPDTVALNPSQIKTNDAETAKSVIKQLWASGDSRGAMIAVNEGVRTVAYPDQHGNMSVGIGYNIEANRNTVVQDFKDAGIQFTPDAIKNKQGSLTRDQAVRLYQITAKRAEEQASAAYDAHTGAPGSFASLPHPEKSVLTDMAFQTGPAGVTKFKDFMNELVNHNTRWGDKTDTLARRYISSTDGKEGATSPRRTNMRLSMLTGTLESNLRHSKLID